MKNDWNSFIDDRIDTERTAYKTTLESQHRKTIEAQISEMLTTNLTQSERTMVEEILFTLGTMQEQDGKRLYQQGMKDCVEVLKELGVLEKTRN